MTTGQKISSERRKLGLTQEQLADKMEVSRQAVSRWESDLAFPETEKIIKLARLYGCSTDYLLRYDEEKQDVAEAAQAKRSPLSFSLSSVCFEYVSKTKLCGMPLVHINLGFGRAAKGIIAIGMRSKGVLSIGIFSMGIFSPGVFALGIFSFAAFALALISFGAVSVGVFSGGAIALGFVTLGAVSIGCFSNGALAVGKYVAAGDVAYGNIALAKTAANGNVISLVFADGLKFEDFITEINAAIDVTVPSFLRWLAHITVSVGKIMFP